MITIEHCMNIHVDCIFISDEGVTMHYRDNGTMDEVTERICENMVKHNFVCAEARDTCTNQILVSVERS